MTKSLLPLILITFFFNTMHAQSGKWALQFGIGPATEQNLGDIGLRTMGKAVYQLKNHWNLNAGMGSFQMLRSAEQWEPIFEYHEARSLSFYHWDLGAGLSAIHKSRFNMGVNLGATCRTGRQLWAQSADYINGILSTYYTHEKINEVGYWASLDASFKVTDKLWLGLNVNSHNYNFIGEYLGASVFATVHPF